MIKIEQQVCSLELAKRIKELGVEQESLFYYNNKEICIAKRLHYIKDRSHITTFSSSYHSCNNEKIYSAFTVAELGVMLPSIITLNNRKHILNYQKSLLNGVFLITYRERKKNGRYFKVVNSSEANCRAIMLINLIENGLVEVHKL